MIWVGLMIWTALLGVIWTLELIVIELRKYRRRITNGTKTNTTTTRTD